MKKQKKLVVGNWKMNPQSLEEAKKLATSVKRAMRGIKKTNVVLCPPFIYLSSLSSSAGNSFFLGAQNANYEALGPFTGEVSFSELSQFKVDYVILGHSERRKMGESDELINKKIRAVVGGGMTAIICVGESVRDINGDFYNFIKQQITSALKDVSKKLLDQIVIAYEPIWAIGASAPVSPAELCEMSIFIKKVLKDLCGAFSGGIKVIYGGDADKVNADILVRDGNVSGLLVGRESLRAKDFIEIIKLVDAI
ncbi:MAG: triose-phosphate isomerase [Candidatus Zambryskibacteria bacterium]|nr:triose-phosphate isomerase [Candidatus Zambryskibacteria bacterium]